MGELHSCGSVFHLTSSFFVWLDIILLYSIF